MLVFMSVVTATLSAICFFVAVDSKREIEIAARTRRVNPSAKRMRKKSLRIGIAFALLSFFSLGAAIFGL